VSQTESALFSGMILGGPNEGDWLSYDYPTLQIRIRGTAPEFVAWSRDDSPALTTSDSQIEAYEFTRITHDVGIWRHVSIPLEGTLSYLMDRFSALARDQQSTESP
jgi:hypothetical protein